MEKICTKCKSCKPFEQFSKDKYKPTGYRTACKACSAKEFASYAKKPFYQERLGKYKTNRKQRKQDNPQRAWALNAINSAKARSKKLGVEFAITKEWLLSILVDVCPLLGVELDYSATTSHACCASLDRKDSSKGYTVDNCKVISFKANRIKTNATPEEIVRLASAIMDY